MLDELHIASGLLRAAIDRYADACRSIRDSLAGDRSEFEGPIRSTLTNELSMLIGYEAKLHESRAMVSQSVNLSSDVVPERRIPVETLVYVFQLLVDMQHLPWFQNVPNYPLKLSHVCTSWRQIVHDSPSLWSCISLVSSETINKEYLEFYSSRTKEASLDIRVFNDSNNVDESHSSRFTIPVPFIGRIRSLEMRLYDPYHSYIDKRDGEYLLATCLKASKNMLKRLALHLVPSLYNNSECPNPHSLNTDKLEDALAPITDLWLGGVYFNWGSKAYHGLVSLRLDHTNSYPISEIQLASILESSPQLRWIEIQLEITRTIDGPYLPPVHLPDLELVVGVTALLRLIRPGSKELTVSIIDTNSKVPYDAALNDFFSCANLVNFYSDRFLQNTSDVCRLISIAPGLRGLAMSHADLLDTLPDMTYTPLDTLYLLDGCVLERYLLEDMIDRWAIKKLVVLIDTYIVHDGKATLLYHLREEYSGYEEFSGLQEEFSSLLSSGVQLEFHIQSYSPSWSPPMNLFLGPPRQ
ncbi:hypothetical protein RSAG8_03215, partial [Rhizoctonia solani AG-8 WAC10335]